MSQELKDLNFPDLVETYSNRALCGLLEKGGPGLKTEIYLAMMTAITWNKERAEAERLKKAKDKHKRKRKCHKKPKN